jgi:hypothetical protein
LPPASISALTLPYRITIFDLTIVDIDQVRVYIAVQRYLFSAQVDPVRAYTLLESVARQLKFQI